MVVGGAIGLTVAIGGLPGSGSTPTLNGSGARPAKSELQERSAKDFDVLKVRWQNKGYQVDVRTKFDEDCSVHSYGRVHDFFGSNACDLLSRAVFELRDKNRNVVLVSVSRVDMPSADTAAELKTLVDTNGTGNVTELSRESGPYRSVRYTGQGYTSGIDGLTVRNSNSQVEPVGWWPGVVIMNELRDEAWP